MAVITHILTFIAGVFVGGAFVLYVELAESRDEFWDDDE